MSLAIFSGCTARLVSDLVGHPEDRFSHVAAQLIPVFDESFSPYALKLGITAPVMPCPVFTISTQSMVFVALVGSPGYQFVNVKGFPDSQTNTPSTAVSLPPIQYLPLVTHPKT